MYFVAKVEVTLNRDPVNRINQEFRFFFLNDIILNCIINLELQLYRDETFIPLGQSK